MELLLIVFVVGYFFQHLASLLLIKSIFEKKSVEGLSPETQVLYLIGALARCIWVHDTRLIQMKLIWFELILSVVLATIVCYLFFYKFAHTRINDVKNPFSYWILVVFCAILSFFFHPGTKNEYYMTIQQLVSFTMFCEAVGMLPQIYLIRKVGQVEAKLTYYILLLGLSRLLRLSFWLQMYWEGDTFLYLVIADLLHTVLLGDFVYMYFKQGKNGLIILS